MAGDKHFRDLCGQGMRQLHQLSVSQRRAELAQQKQLITYTKIYRLLGHLDLSLREKTLNPTEWIDQNFEQVNAALGNN